MSAADCCKAFPSRRGKAACSMRASRRRSTPTIRPSMRWWMRPSPLLVTSRAGAGGHDGRSGDIVINPDHESAKRLPTRYADYPLRQGDVFRLDTPGGGGFGDPLEREPERVLADVREGYVSREAAEKDYAV